MIHLVATGKFESIERRFLVSGHSFMFMPRDQDSSIHKYAERVLFSFYCRKTEKDGESHGPLEIEEMIRTARLNNPFTIVNIDKKYIFNSSLLANILLNTTMVGISHVTRLQVTMQSLLKGSILTKHMYGDPEE